MNECHFTGKLCFDPEIRTFANGGKKVRLRLAINRIFKKQDGAKGEKTVYADFEAWDTGAQTIADHFQKGDSIVITNASLEQDNWEKDGEKKSKLYFRINHFEFPARSRNRDEAPSQARSERSNRPVNEETEDLAPVTGGEDDIPF